MKRKRFEKIVDAVLNAPLENKEIIIVDDCSQDGTRAESRQDEFLETVDPNSLFIQKSGEEAGGCCPAVRRAGLVRLLSAGTSILATEPEETHCFMELFLSGGKADRSASALLAAGGIGCFFIWAYELGQIEWYQHVA